MSAEITVTTTNVGVTLSTGTVTSITAGAGLTGGVITTSGTIAVDFAPDGAGTATQVPGATDLRLSNARTPTVHATSHGIGGGDPIPAGGLAQSQVANLTTDLAGKLANTVSVSAGTGLTGGGLISSNPSIAADIAPSGSGTATQLVSATDTRLSDSRTPTTHATTHGALGSDPITVAQSQVTNLTSDLATKVATTRQIIAGTGLSGGGDLSADRTLAVDFAVSGGGGAGEAVEATDLRLSNSRAPTGAAGGDLAGAFPSPTIASLASRPIDTTPPAVADVWQFDGSQWSHIPQASLTTNAGTFANQPIDVTAPSAGDLWVYSGSQWQHDAQSTLAVNATQVSFTAPGIGATSRTATSRFNDIISVKDYGAVGDGTTDDTAAISAALTAAMGKTLFFPSGVYVLAAITTQQIQKTLTDSLEIVGEEATIKCVPSSGHVAQMLFINPVGHTFKMSGMTFDANNLALTCLQVIDSANQDNYSAYLDRCTFRNTFGIAGGVGGWVTNVGAWFGGGFDMVSITNCVSENHSRAFNASIPFTSSTLGLFIAGSGTVFPRNVLISGCSISNITNSNTNASDFNLDCDGISIFGGLSTTGTYVASRAMVVNNTFLNCKGRSIKIQNDESTVTNNTIRFAIKPIGTFSGGQLFTHGGIIEMQGAGGTITGNVFHYDLAPGGQNPFSVLNTPPALDEGGFCFGNPFSPGINATRPRSVLFADNVIYNNVPESVGFLKNVVQTAESVANLPTGANAQPGFVTIRNNRLLGGAVQDFAFVGLRRSDLANGIMYMTLAENYASKMQRSFMVAGSGATYDNNQITCMNNVNAASTPVAHLIDNTTGTPIVPATITAIANIGIGLTASQEGASSTAFLPRFGGCSPMQEGFAGIAMQTVTLASAAEHTFPRRYSNVEGATFLIVSANVGGAANAMFTIQGSTGGTIITNWANSAADIAASGGPPSVAGTLGIGRDVSTGTIRIKNNFTGSKSFTLFTFG